MALVKHNVLPTLLLNPLELNITEDKYAAMLIGINTWPRTSHYPIMLPLTMLCGPCPVQPHSLVTLLPNLVFPFLPPLPILRWWPYCLNRWKYLKKILISWHLYWTLSYPCHRGTTIFLTKLVSFPFITRYYPVLFTKGCWFSMTSLFCVIIFESNWIISINIETCISLL